MSTATPALVEIPVEDASTRHEAQAVRFPWPAQN